MMHIVDQGPVQMQPKIAIIGWQIDLLFFDNEFLASPPVSDQLLNGAKFELMLFGKRKQFRKTSHAAVVVHDLSQNTSWPQPSQPCKIDRCLGVSGTAQDTSLPIAQRKYVARANQIVRASRRIGKEADRSCPIGSGNTGCYSRFRVNRDG